MKGVSDLLIILSILLPIAGAIAAFRMKDDQQRHKLTAAAVILSSVLAVITALTGFGSSVTVMNTRPLPAPIS